MAADAFPGLGYRFADPGLLRQALSHRSVGMPHNERLEFLGDGLVGAIVAELLHERFPKASEGQLTRLRAQLVRREALAGLARELSLGDHLRLGPGELKSGGYRRESILADAFEALVAAIYLDGGWETCRGWLRERSAGALDALDVSRTADAKTRLQEWLQGRGRGLPVYTVLNASGEAHAQNFEVECRAEGVAQTSRGRAGSRKQAEQIAAEAMLELLEGPTS